MIRPLLQNQALLDDVKRAASPTDFFLWWLGQSGFLLKWRDACLLIDPYLSDSLTQKYAGTATEHVRLTERCVAPEALDFVATVTASHAHTDHMDAATLRPLANRFLARDRALKLVLPTSALALARARLGEGGIEFLGLDAGEIIDAAPFTFEAVPSAHVTVERDAAGHCLFLGYLIRFGPWTVYHSGDTVRYEGLAERLRPQRIDVALLPINGHDPARGVAGNLDGAEAATLAHDIGARLAIPQHFGMFAFNTATPDDFVAACKQLDQPHAVLRCGERWCSTGLGANPGI